MSRAYKPKNAAFYSAFARQLCEASPLPGWLSAFPEHSQTFMSTPESFTHANSHHDIQRTRKFLGLFF